MKELNQIYLPIVDSTNSYLKLHFESLPDATFVSAGEQTAGRGRLQRKWISPPDTNIYASFLMKECRDGFRATIVSSLAVLDMIRENVSEEIPFFIKWPNDIYCGNRKLAGILSEGIWENGGFQGIIAGMGININLPPDELNRIEQPAASLFSLTGKKYNLKNLTDLLAKSVMKWYINVLNFPEGTYSLWKRENKLIGKSLEFITADGMNIRAVLEDIAPDGAALIREKSGKLSRFTCGDLKINRDSLNR